MGKRKQNSKALSVDEIIKMVDLVHKETARIAAKRMVRKLVEATSTQGRHEDSLIYRHFYESVYGATDNVFGAAKDWAGNAGSSGPMQGEFTLEGVTVSVRVTHRLPPETVYGVDVVYVIEGEKALAIQHKRLDEKGGITLSQKETEQWKKISKTCIACPRKLKAGVRAVVSEVMKKYFQIEFYETAGFVQPACSAMYFLTADGERGGLVSACMLDRFRMIRSTSAFKLELLVDRKILDEAFAKCLVGFRTGDGAHQPASDIFNVDHDLIFEVFIRTKSNNK